MDLKCKQCWKLIQLFATYVGLSIEIVISFCTCKYKCHPQTEIFDHVSMTIELVLDSAYCSQQRVYLLRTHFLLTYSIVLPTLKFAVPDILTRIMSEHYMFHGTNLQLFDFISGLVGYW